MSEDEQQEIKALTETAIEQKLVPFEGDDLAAAKGQSGDIFVSISGICRALGLNTQSQTRRISRTKTLAKGLRQIPIKGKRGGEQLTYCLRTDRIALWLAGVETEKLKPEVQDRIETYQEDLAKVANIIFARHMGIPMSTENTQAVTEYESLRDILQLMIDHLSALAIMPTQLDTIANMLSKLVEQQQITATAVTTLTSHVTPAQKNTIAQAVNKIVVDATLNHAQVYALIHNHFHVARYDEIPTERFEEVMNLLRQIWKDATSGTLPEQGNLF